MLCNVVLVSAIRQHESSISIHILPSEPPPLLPPHVTPLGHHRAPGWAPCVVEQLPTSYLFCTELTHWKRPWCWEGLGAGGDGDDRGWDGWMASPTWWRWVWVNSGSWWWTGRPGMLLFMGLQRVGHYWVTELNWTQRLVEI